jgi:hypothetical protein
VPDPLRDSPHAEVAIANLIAEYAERVDLGDFAAVGRLFAHATYRALLPNGDVATSSGAQEVTQVMSSMVLTYDGVPATKHLMTNIIVDIDGNVAHSRSYFTVFQARPDLPLQPIIAGRYHDRFERADDCWRFADRLILTDLVGDLGHHLRANPYAG